MKHMGRYRTGPFCNSALFWTCLEDCRLFASILLEQGLPRIVLVGGGKGDTDGWLDQFTEWEASRLHGREYPSASPL